MSIYINNGNHFQQSDDHEADGAGEGVEHLEPVLARARREDQTHEETHSAYETCDEWK